MKKIAIAALILLVLILVIPLSGILAERRPCIRFESPDKRFVLEGIPSWSNIGFQCSNGSGYMYLEGRDGKKISEDYDCMVLEVMEVTWKSDSLFFECLYSGDRLPLPPLREDATEDEQLTRNMHLFEEAAARNDVEALKRLKATLPVGPNFKIDGRVPLASATRAGAIGAVRALLDMGADPNFAHAQGQGSLFTSFYNLPPQHVHEMLRILVDKGLNINSTPPGRFPLLFMAKDVPLLRLLISLGADVKMRLWSGETALFNGHDAATSQYLVEQGVDWQAVDSNGQTARQRLCDQSLETSSTGRLKQTCDYLASLELKSKTPQT